MKKAYFILVIILFCLEAQATLVVLKDGKELQGEFWGARSKSFFSGTRTFYLNDRGTLYAIPHGKIKKIFDDDLQDVTQKALKTKTVRINWSEVDKVSVEGKKVPKIKYPAAHNLQVTLDADSTLNLTWRTEKKYEHVIIEKKIGDGLWLPQEGALAAERIFLDTEKITNQFVYYRLKTVIPEKKRKKMLPQEEFQLYTPPVKAIIFDDELQKIPDGEFFFNSKVSQDSLKKVEISAFYLSKTEVTVKEYCQALNYALNKGYLSGDYQNNITVTNFYGDKQELIDLDDTDCPLRFEQNFFHSKPGKADYPVTEVSWYGAAFYCNMLGDFARQFSEIMPLYNLEDWQILPIDKPGYRLPSEAEWEYAARYPDNRLYPWGNDKNEKTLKIELTEVGVNKDNRSRLGLYDLLGNVAEWCQDNFSIANYFASRDPVCTEPSRYKVIKGGAWNSFSAQLDLLSKERAEPTSTLNTIGFRYCRVIPQKNSAPPSEPDDSLFKIK